MSRIGRQPVSIPAGVKVSVAGGKVRVEGPKGSLDQAVPAGIGVEVKDNQVLVARPDDTRRNKALHGLTRALINNMVNGVAKGFEKELHIEGVGYRAAVAGSKLNLTLGYSHPVEFEIPKGITITVEAQTEVKISGIDRALVGQVAANIRFLREPEVYRGKGVRYKDEHIRRKAGKTASTGK
ncbi:MAG TPA: 50S ribosomal protein L6 [bacterium]|jgi:large subunit ribosomal protein L6|nr:50S ribosomal protein L6 [bacterium]